MAGKGASPGERRGGREAGVKNKATLEKELLAERIMAEQANKPGRKLAKEVLDDFMHLFMGLAAQHQPLPQGVVDPSGAKRDEDKFIRYANMAGEFAGKLAKFQSPTFGMVKVSLEPRPGGELEQSQVAPSVPGQVQSLTPSQAYRLLRDADVIDMDGVPAPVRKSNKAANG